MTLDIAREFRVVGRIQDAGGDRRLPNSLENLAWPIRLGLALDAKPLKLSDYLAPPAGCRPLGWQEVPRRAGTRPYAGGDTKN